MSETPIADPVLAVQCPECRAPAGEPCATRYGTHHSERQRLIDLRALTQGTCALCNQFMVKGTVLDTPLDAWHPDPTDAARCPELPDPSRNWNEYAAAVNLGVRPGYPGMEHFRPALNPEDCCPECRGEKHGNCTHTIPVGDGPEVKACACRTLNPACTQ